MKRLTVALLALITAAALTGCGEISNTLTPSPGSANHITIALDDTSKFNQVGIYEAQVAGFFAQTDLSVSFVTTKRPLRAIEDGQAEIALSNEPEVILTRNRHTALAAVAAVVQSPGLVTVSCKAPRAKRSPARKPATTTTGAATTTTTPGTTGHCSATQGGPASAYAHAPTYNGLNLVVTEAEIVNHADVLRRAVQAIGRGYIAVRSDPAAATHNLLKADPGLDYTAELTGVEASLTNFFPTDTTLPWGFQVTKDWNAFGSWLYQQRIITDVNAPISASSNELLAGQGV